MFSLGYFPCTDPQPWSLSINSHLSMLYLERSPIPFLSYKIPLQWSLRPSQWPWIESALPFLTSVISNFFFNRTTQTPDSCPTCQPLTVTSLPLLPVPPTVGPYLRVQWEAPSLVPPLQIQAPLHLHPWRLRAVQDMPLQVNPSPQVHRANCALALNTFYNMNTKIGHKRTLKYKHTVLIHCF